MWPSFSPRVVAQRPWQFEIFISGPRSLWPQDEIYSEAVPCAGIVFRFHALANLAWSVCLSNGSHTHSNPNMHCTSCKERQYTGITSAFTVNCITVNCTYKELRQSSDNGCPRCAFVLAWIRVCVDYLNITESTAIWALEYTGKCHICTDDVHFTLDLFKMNSETGEYLHHYKFRFSPSNCK